MKKIFNIFLAMMFCASNLFSMDRFFLKASCDSASDSSSSGSSSSEYNASASNISASVSSFSSEEDEAIERVKAQESAKERKFESTCNQFKQFIKKNPNVKIDPVYVRYYFNIWNRSLSFEKEAFERTDPISCKIIELINLMPKNGVYNLDELIKILLKRLDVSCN